MEKEYVGTNGMIILGERSLILKRGRRGFLLGGFVVRGDKTVPYSSIVAVQFKKPNIASSGYIQFTLTGGSEAKAGIFQAAQDENSILFGAKKAKDFEELKNIVESRIGQTHTTSSTSSLDELVKLGELRNSGILTDEEFEAKKKQLLASS